MKAFIHGTIYMWIPRFAYNKKDILYIKQESSVAGTWTIPEIFTYETENFDLSLSGFWVEYDTTIDSSKVNNMKGENNSYGFISNTVGTIASRDPLYDSDIIENYINSIVIDPLMPLPLNDPTNKSRGILKIINTNKIEPIKGNAYYDEVEGKIKIEVTNSKNKISKIVDRKGNILSENSNTADTGSNIIGDGTHKFIAIDNLGQQKLIKAVVTGLDIYVISDEEELNEFKIAVTKGRTTENTKAYQVADVKLNEGNYTIDSTTGDIVFDDTKAEIWEPIRGIYKGTYYGNNHTISGIYGSDGLFKETRGAKIQDLGIIESSITATHEKVGAIANCAEYDTVLENCFSEATITSKYQYTGGLVGAGITSSGYKSPITFRNCYNKGKIVSKGSYTGGLLGLNSGDTIIENSYNTAEISGSGYIGGIVGRGSPMRISNCYNTGNINGTSSYVGGIAGNGITIITNCYNVGNVTGKSDYTGGIVGYSSWGSDIDSNITNCYNIGNITGVRYTGGILGYVNDYAANDIITKCYNLGNINGTSSYVGGIVGYLYGGKSSKTCSYVYNYGEINGTSNVGGIIGNIDQAIASNCYNVGNVTGTSSSIGGIVGYHTYRTNESQVTVAYNLGNVTGDKYVGGITGYQTDNGITSNSYNSGNITGKTYVGAIIGTVNGTISGNYYKTGTAAFGVGKSSTGLDSGTTSTYSMPAVLNVVGTSYFKNDSYGINNGYPILSWQTDNDKLNLINGSGAFVEDTQGLNGGYPILAWELERKK